MQPAETDVFTGISFAGAVRRISLREEIAEALSDDLVSGRLPAGASLTVNDAARRFGVSATPVREALIHLAAHGLFTGGHHRGFQVPRYTWVDFTEIVEARKLIAVPLIGRVARTVPDEAVPGLALLADRLDAARWYGDTNETALVDRRFFAEIGRLCGNERLVGMLRLLRVQAWMYLGPHLRAATGPAGAWRRHRELVDRLAAHDPDAAQAIMRDCLAGQRDFARRLVGDGPGDLG
ncbi:GntR family transcriptional regulator [Yinghuangia seranimata]|uniref:GntR family transcriptional regulator n=1 Tax=Yinghuangia seranimata TaxID=408067 RepID=UPI00248B0A30|nr:GntR family transcriptional regulator [Yinghuangia seranimata]MDI2130789.1 GntR family transcriptional regulator [Yinghuangia seranimata]